MDKREIEFDPTGHISGNIVLYLKKIQFNLDVEYLIFMINTWIAEQENSHSKEELFERTYATKDSFGSASQASKVYT